MICIIIYGSMYGTTDSYIPEYIHTYAQKSPWPIFSTLNTYVVGWTNMSRITLTSSLVALD